jgi:large subunit ribosomal protein L6
MKYVAIDDELEIPEDVEIEVSPQKEVTVKGEKGEATKDFSHARFVKIFKEDNKVYFHADFPRKKQIALVGTIKNVINNLIRGVQEEYTYKMKIVYSHFPITVVPPKGSSKDILIKNFIGERAPRVTQAIGNVKITSNKEEVFVSGVDRDAVGQTCANIQLKCRIKEKDKRVFQDGIYVYEKLLGDKTLWVIK